MQIEQIRPDELTPDLAARWEALRGSDDAMASPFFASEMARRLGAVCEDLRIAVVCDGAEPVAFVPLHHHGKRTAKLMGYPLMDCQGLIAHRDLELDLPAVVRRLGLARLRFLSVPQGQRWFKPYAFDAASSPMIRVERFRSSPRDLRKLHKLERDVAPVRYTATSTQRDDLQTLLAWKREQIERTGFDRILDTPWIQPLLRDLPGARGQNFAGVLSTLHAGEHLVAAHLGVRSDTFWQMWFPAFDQAFGAYSPGRMLFRLMARTAGEIGVRWIDFGPGPEAFKYSLANDTAVRLRGAVTTSWASTGLARGCRASVRALCQARLDAPARRVRAALRQVRL